MRMKDEIAIVTGSTSGIGKKIAELLLKEGCKVTVCSRNEENVNRTVKEFEEYGDSVLGVSCDVNSAEDMKEAVDKTTGKFGPVRILVANAGVNMTYGPFSYMTPEMVISDSKTVIGTNLTGMMTAVSVVLPQMIKQGYGRIVTVSGGGANRPIGHMSVYSASKGGVVTFSKCLAEELKENRDADILINIFLPGMIKTNLGTNMKPVPGWKSQEEFRKDSELAFDYMGTDIEKSCTKMIPYVLPSCKANGKSIKGFSLKKMIFGGIKLQRAMKKRD